LDEENPKQAKPQEQEIDRYVRQFQSSKDASEAWDRFAQLDREQRENSFREFDPTGAKRAAYRRVYGKECPNLFALESGAGSGKPSRTTADELGADNTPASSVDLNKTGENVKVVDITTTRQVSRANCNPPAFPNRAKWLIAQIHARAWNKHDLSRHRGPDHKTVQKILDGAAVREEILEKVANALSIKGAAISLQDIPPD
jgi:hypothetical protein